MFTTEEIKRFFVQRLDDDMFAALGAMETGVAAQKNSDSHHLVWRGYELLAESIYLPII